MARRHALMRRQAGDYLLVSNDRRDVYRIFRYEEDGTLYQGAWPNEEQITGTYWGVDRLEQDHYDDGDSRGPLVTRNEDGTINEMQHPASDDWRHTSWACVADLFDTRQDAINEVTTE